MYDFEKYYANMDVKAEVNIDLSGVQIENPQGNPNEHVSNNVVYYVTGAWVSNDEEFNDYYELTVDDRIQITSGDDVTYMALFHPLSDILESDVASEWSPTQVRETELVLDSGDDIIYTVYHDGTRTFDKTRVVVVPPSTYLYAKLFVTPRYEFITGVGQDDIRERIKTGNIGPLLVNQNVISAESNVASLSKTMQVIYSILGLCGKRKTSLKSISKLGDGKSGKRNAVIGYDLFRKRIGTISDWCAENNYGVDVKYYDSSMARPLPEGVEDATRKEYKKDRKRARAKHRAYLLACQKADITRTSMKRFTSFNEAYGTQGSTTCKLSEFLAGEDTKPLVDDLRSSGVGVSALIPPIKDAVKGMFYPKEDIENDFYEYFEATFEDLKDALTIMGPYLSDSTQKKIKRIGSAFTQRTEGSRELAFDLDSLVNSFRQNCRKVADDIYATGCRDQEQYVTVYPRVFQIGGEHFPDQGADGTWYANPLADDPTFKGSINFGYVMSNTPKSERKFKTDHYTWDKATTTMTSDEVREILVDSYNWVLKHVDDDGEKYEPVGMDELNIDDTTFTGGYAGNDPSERLAVRQCKRYIEFVGGWMNLFRQYHTVDAIYEFVNAHPIQSGWGVFEWLNDLASQGLISWNLTGDYTVLMWSKSANTNDKKPLVCSKYEPAYITEWGIDPESPDDIDDAIRAAYVMEKAYKEMRTQLVLKAFIMNSYQVVKAWLALENAEEDIAVLNETRDRVVWYQAFVNESVFTNKSMYLNMRNWLNTASGPSDSDDDFVELGFTPWTLPARFMVPVAMYRKVRKRYKRFGFTRHKTVKVYDGVRWAEVRFYDLNVFNEYPVVEETPGNRIALGKPCTIEEVDGKWYLNFDEPLPDSIWKDGGSGEVLFDDAGASTVQVIFDNDMSAHLSDDSGVPPLVGTHNVVSVKVPPEKSRNDVENKTPVTVHVKMASLPYDDEIRKKAFVEYGPMSQDKFFEVYRTGDGGFDDGTDTPRVDGWKVFRPTSRKIEDMREGIGLYDKVSFLLAILKHEFGENRVELINTWRSAEDQKGICTGGPESAMLSWHNYGLAAKILIYQNDCTTPIVDMSEDMKRLVKVAKAFTDICAAGRVGNPCNVVWCGRLTVSPSLFDWEFLPIGVGHKDAFKFREAILDQRDPVMDCSYVDVDAMGIVVERPRNDNLPFILKTSSAYRNALIVNGHHYVSPDRIPNYSTPSDIVLYDIIEYIDLVNLKMEANGNKLGDRANMYEWKAMNDSSCEQLIRYFALTNNIKSAKALIAGDYIEKYQAIEDAYYTKSSIDYVREMLGSHYEDAYITIDSDSDSGYISLANGKMYIKVTDQIPDNVPTMIDMHGQQRVDKHHVKKGVWRNGVFYGLDEIELPYVESDGPVLEGYVDGVPSFGEAAFLHQLVASDIHAEFIKIRDMFERYKGVVMFDRFQDGPNASKFDQLENEFGAIAAQDLMDFDDLESLIAQETIDGLSDVDTASGEHYGVGYEKVVDNALLAGMRKAVQTSERMHITDRGGGMTPGEIYRAIMEGRAPGANDLMSGR